jgi:hypothetical protein
MSEQGKQLHSCVIVGFHPNARSTLRSAGAPGSQCETAPLDWPPAATQRRQNISDTPIDY